MAKSIVILFDGTSNEIERDRTNVLRLYGVLEKSERQLVYYDPGVGTLGAAAWSRLWRKASEIWGLATGYGLDANVKEAYRFLVENYAGGGDERDRIYIVGFSRGAYTARVLAGFIHAVGLIEAHNLNLLDYAYRAYSSIGEDKETAGSASGEGNAAFAGVRLYERLLRADRPPIRMLGLFDTVASVIESTPGGLRLKSHAFTRRNRSVESVIHAVAIDERRTMFRPQLWLAGQTHTPNPFDRRSAAPQDLEEVWFAGSHGDIGGGSPEAESALCKVPLEWLIGHAQRCGLHFTAESVNAVVYGQPAGSKYVPPDPLAASHNSMRSGWRLLEFVPRRKPHDSSRPSLFGLSLPLFERRAIPPGAKIHRSVAARRDAGMGWPPNIPAQHTVV